MIGVSRLIDRIRRKITLLRRGLWGTPHFRPSPDARRLTVASMVAVPCLAAAALYGAFTRPPAGEALADALEIMPTSPIAFRKALDLTWRREMNLAGSLDDAGTGYLAPNAPPALCPAADGSVAAAERLRQLAAGLDGALRDRRKHPDRAREALSDFDTASIPAHPQAEFYQRYNVARGFLLLGDSAAAARLLATYFEDHPDNFLQEPVSGHRARLLFHARMVAALAAMPRRDTLAISHFRGAVRMLKVLAPAARTAWAGDGSHRAFQVDPGQARCERTPEAEWSRSMDTWAGLVAAYRQADGFRDTRDLRYSELVDLDDDPNDPFYPLLRHGLAASEGRTTPIPERFFWAASNLRRVYASNRLSPDPRLEVARAVLLVDLVDRPDWLRAVSASRKMERCTVLGRLASDFARNMRGSGGAETLADSLRAAMAIHVHARLRGCDAPVEVDEALQSQWIRLGARMLGDTVGARAEGWRLALRSTPDTVAQTLGRAVALEDRLAPRGARRSLALRGDTTYRFLTRWRRALFSEAADSLRERCAADRLDAAATGTLPRVMLATALHTGDPPAAVYSTGDLRRVLEPRGETVPVTHFYRYTAGNHPLATLFAVTAAAFAVLWAIFRRYLWTWRRRILVEGRFYRDETPGRE